MGYVGENPWRMILLGCLEKKEDYRVAALRRTIARWTSLAIIVLGRGRQISYLDITSDIKIQDVIYSNQTDRKVTPSKYRTVFLNLFGGSIWDI